MSEAHVESQTMAQDHHGTTPAEDDNTNLRAVTIWFVGIVLSVVVAVIFITQYFGIQVRKEIEAKVLTVENPVLRDLRASEQAKLTKYQWVNKEAGVVRIPVERAKELTLRDWSSRAKAVVPAAEVAEGAESAEGAEASPAENAAPTEASKEAEGAE